MSRTFSFVIRARCETGSMALHITGDTAADALLTDNPLALLVGMLLDQQVAMETAFAGPLKIEQRTGAADAASIASYDPEEFLAAFRQTPSVHRFPGSMAARVQTLCQKLVDDWGGDAAALWTQGDPDGAEVLRRLKTLPGFGEQKAKIFLALLGKPVRRGRVLPFCRRHRLAGIAREGPRAQARHEGRREGDGLSAHIMTMSPSWARYSSVAGITGSDSAPVR